MMLDPVGAASKFDAALRSLGMPERAEGTKRYLKSDLTFYGVTQPELRHLARRFLKDHPGLSRRDLAAVVEELWSEPVHERRMLAIVLLESRVDLLTASDVELIERLIRASKTWAFVDPLATNVMGALHERNDDLGRLLDRWATDDDFWIRRSALLTLLKPVTAGHEFERFARYADEMLEEKEFFIRKAIGWVLRELSKKEPDRVRAWVTPRLERMSGVTRREATKYLD